MAKPKKKKPNPHAVALGRLGGLAAAGAGARAMHAALTPAQRRANARRAAKARWSKKKRAKSQDRT
jgi:hypothetical protein